MGTNQARDALRRNVTGAIERGEAQAVTEQRKATVDEARELLKAGKRLRIVIGPGADDPTIVLSLRDGMVFCESVAGWSAGVVEPACELGSDYLASYCDKPVEVLDPGAPAWPAWL